MKILCLCQLSVAKRFCSHFKKKSYQGMGKSRKPSHLEKFFDATKTTILTVMKGCSRIMSVAFGTIKAFSFRWKFKSTMYDTAWSTRDIPQIYYILGKCELAKNLIKIFKKIVQTLGMYSSIPFKALTNTLPIVKTSISWFKRPRKFVKPQKWHFLLIFQNPWFWFWNKEMGVDQVLTKLFQIDPKLTFDVFNILNEGRISKIEKNIRWSRPPPKMTIFGP